jgi:hypothetical protein
MDPPNQSNAPNLQSGQLDGTIEDQEEKTRQGLNDGQLRISNIQIPDLPSDDSSSDVLSPKITNGSQKIEEGETPSLDGKNTGDSPENNGKENPNKKILQNGKNADKTLPNDETNVMEPNEAPSRENFDKFWQLKKAKRFVDKTKLIMDFRCEFLDPTCILRARRSGKSLSIDMIREFFCLPEIDVESYDPVTKKHKNVNRTSESIFEGTAI